MAINEENVRQNSLKAWYLAARPKTLTAALIPVIVACALALHDDTFKTGAAVVCAVFASLMQIASNLVNDLYDFMKGTDGYDRLGPKRATAQGWITPAAMKGGIIAVMALACAAGCILVSQSGWWLVAVGAACVVFAILYTTLLSYLGLGDLLVLVFFGIVPVNSTYYLQAGILTPEVVLCSFACGIVVDTLLVLNNFRDRDSDRRTGKRTIVVMFGERFGRLLYLLLGICAYLLVVPLVFMEMWPAAVITLPYLVIHTRTWREMVRIDHGRELNVILGKTSRNMFVFALLLSAGILLS